MEHLINLNFAPGGLPATVHVSQYDDTIRQLRFQLWFGRSKVEVPSGASVRVDIKKPDGHIVLVSGTVDSSDRSIVTVPTTKQMTAAPGGARGTLVVSSTGDKRISSAIFILQVHRDPVEDGDASDSDLSMLQDAIDQTAANASAAEAAAAEAQEAASSFTTDTTLSVTGKAADAKKTGDEISAIKADLDSQVESINDIFTNNAKRLLLNSLQNLAWLSADSRMLYNNLEVALFNGDVFNKWHYKLTDGDLIYSHASASPNQSETDYPSRMYMGASTRRRNISVNYGVAPYYIINEVETPSLCYPVPIPQTAKKYTISMTPKQFIYISVVPYNTTRNWYDNALSGNTVQWVQLNNPLTKDIVRGTNVSQLFMNINIKKNDAGTDYTDNDEVTEFTIDFSV